MIVIGGFPGFRESPLDPDLRPRNIREYSPIPPPVFPDSCHPTQLAPDVEYSIGLLRKMFSMIDCSFVTAFMLSVIE